MDEALRSFSAFMDAGGPAFVATVILLISPCALLVHELGHACVPLLRTEGLVHVRLGRSPGWVRGRLGRLLFAVSPLPARGDANGLASVFAKLEPGEKIAFVLAGPAAEVGLGALCALGALAQQGRLRAGLAIAAFVAVVQAVGNLVPFEVYGHKSDGLHLLEQLRLRSAPQRHALDGSDVDGFVREFAQTRARWVALVTDARSGTRSGERARAIAQLAAAVAPALDRRPIRMLVYAGWCWRHVERPSAETPSIVSDAVEQAIQDGLSGSALQVAATLAVAQPALEPSALDRPSRQGFLARAVRTIPPPGDIDVPEHVKRRAFLAGVALHDVETASR